MKKYSGLFILILYLISGKTLAQNMVLNSGFEKQAGQMPERWNTFTPRTEISPEFGIDNKTSRSGTVSARITSRGSKGTYGSWTTVIKGIESAATQPELRITMADQDFLGRNNYLIGCYFRTDVVSPDQNIRVKISWLDKANNELLTEFISKKFRENDWYRFSEIKTAPVNAAALRLSLVLQWTGKGSVWWDDISVEKAPVSDRRTVSIASASDWPASPSTTEKNLQYYSGKIVEAGEKGADIVCLGEGITMVSTGRSFEEVGEQIPGNTTRVLGEAAKKAGAYVIAGIYERDGSLIYNTAVLIDRNGNVTGKYRKTHLPQTEVEGGLTPGDDYPVFETDFGKIGIEICYDNFFPEVAHNLMLNGAEIIFCPIWGDIRGFKKEWETVSVARAIDNSVFFVASMYEKGMSVIIDPNGKILNDTAHSEGLIVSSADLSQRTFERWLSVKSFGEWRNLMPNEVRKDTY
jgi:predicted amidohydrolase